MSKTVTIFKHTHHDGSCFLGKTLEEQEFNITSIGVPTVGIKDFDALAPDLLLVMGGPVGVYQAKHYPFIYDEIEVLKKRIAADKPTLGICLGAQLIAKALGADVYKGANGLEAAWHPLTVHDTAQNHPVRHLCKTKTNMFHWHGDTFDLPEGSTLLASSETYKNQAFSYGQNILGLQCHAEVNHRKLNEWYVVFVSQITGDNPVIHIEDLKRQSNEYMDTLNRQVRLFFLEWLKTVGL